MWHAVQLLSLPHTPLSLSLDSLAVAWIALQALPAPLSPPGLLCTNQITACCCCCCCLQPFRTLLPQQLTQTEEAQSEKSLNRGRRWRQADLRWSLCSCSLILQTWPWNTGKAGASSSENIQVKLMSNSHWLRRASAQGGVRNKHFQTFFPLKWKSANLTESSLIFPHHISQGLWCHKGLPYLSQLCSSLSKQGYGLNKPYFFCLLHLKIRLFVGGCKHRAKSAVFWITDRERLPHWRPALKTKIWKLA